MSTEIQKTVLTYEEVCEVTGISLPTLNRLIRDGRGPKIIKLSERRRGIRREALEAWLSEREGAQ